MAEEQRAEGAKPAAPPYIAFQSLKTLSKDMKQHGVPSRIDRSVLTNFSGAVGGQLITALKFLNLISDDGHPNERMKALVQAYDTDAWGTELADVLKKAYHPVFQLNLETASPGQFMEVFRKAYPGADEVQRKSITFFLNALRETPVKISPYIMKNKKPRTTPAKRRAKANGVKSAGSESPSGVASPRQEKPIPTDDRPPRPLRPRLIEALYDSLPPDGQTWTMQEAEDWLQAAAYNFRYAYKLPGVIKITIMQETRQTN